MRLFEDLEFLNILIETFLLQLVPAINAHRSKLKVFENKALLLF